MEELYYSYTESPVGTLLLAGSDRGLAKIVFSRGKAAARADSRWELRKSPFREAVHQLGAYFQGRLRNFDLLLAPEGTPFQLRVWRELAKIPYGTTASYLDIARRIGNPKAVRAVGAANGRNPLPIVIPCHRVIGRNGQLTGYGGGLRVKAALLELESRYLAASSP